MISEFTGIDNTWGRLLARAYEGLRHLDRARTAFIKTVRPPIPTISIGNITVGGSGKTPLVLYVAEWLRAQGKRPVILSRGYLGRESGPAAVIPPFDARRFGDEAAMCARRGFAVWVAKKREAAVAAACVDHDVLLLDDGFQRRQIERDLDVVTFSQDGLGNGQLLPAGTLRDNVRALALADAFCGPLSGLPRVYPETPRFVFDYQGLKLTPAPPKNAKLAALAAIAKPSHFFAALEHQGFVLQHRFALPDHDPLLPNTLLGVHRLCNRQNISHLLVTEKDAVKMPPRLGNTQVCVAIAQYGPSDRQTAAAFARFVQNRLGF